MRSALCLSFFLAGCGLTAPPAQIDAGDVLRALPDRIAGGDRLALAGEVRGEERVREVVVYLAAPDVDPRCEPHQPGRPPDPAGCARALRVVIPVDPAARIVRIDTFAVVPLDATSEVVLVPVRVSALLENGVGVDARIVTLAAPE